MAHPYVRSKRGPSKSDIKLTPAEKDLLARDSLRMMFENENLTRVDALRQATHGLPPERRKTITDMAHNKWVIPLWDAIAAERDMLNGTSEEPVMPHDVAIAELEPQVESPLQLTGLQADISAPVMETPVPAKRRGMAKGTKLIRWTQAERRTVAKAYLKLMHDFPDLSKSDGIRRAMQYSLPDNRQRQCAGYSMEKNWLEPLLVEVANEVVIEREAQAQHRAEVEAAESAEIQHKHDIEAVEKTAVELAELAAQEARSEALTEFRTNVTIEELLGLAARKLVKAIARPIIEALREEIAGSMDALLPTISQPVLKAVPPVPRDRKPLVGVFGLIHQQAQQLERDYAGRIEFVFGGTQDGSGPRGGYEKAEKCDLVLLMAEYVSHDVRRKLQGANIKFEPLLGSMSAARVALDKWLSGEGRLAA